MKIYKEKEVAPGLTCIFTKDHMQKRINFSQGDRAEKIDQYKVLKQIQDGTEKYYLIQNHKGTFKVPVAEVFLNIPVEPKLYESDCEWEIAIEPRKPSCKDPLIETFKAIKFQAEKGNFCSEEMKSKIDEINILATADENGYVKEPPLHIRQPGKKSGKEPLELNIQTCSELLKLAGLDDREPITIVQKKVKKMGQLMKQLNSEWNDLRKALPQLIDLYVDRRRTKKSQSNCR